MYRFSVVVVVVVVVKYRPQQTHAFNPKKPGNCYFYVWIVGHVYMLIRRVGAEKQGGPDRVHKESNLAVADTVPIDIGVSV
jgi:hypothetical protein